VTATSGALARPRAQSHHLSRARLAGWGWSGLLLTLLAFLVLYPISMLLYPTFRTLTVHYLRLATGRVSEGELLARTVDGGLYREQLKYLRLNRC
jgi:hypothetical protein